MIGLVAIRETRPGTRKRVEKVFCGHASSVDYQRLRRPRWKDGIELGDESRESGYLPCAKNNEEQKG